MSVYIDSMNAPFGRMLMCHMMADTKEELLDMATKIGVAHKWIQDTGTYREHFDICLSKKKKALSLGAKEVSWREMADLLKLKASMWLQEKGQEPDTNPKEKKLAEWCTREKEDIKQ